jgi:hypothetical protein
VQLTQVRLRACYVAHTARVLPTGRAGLITCGRPLHETRLMDPARCRSTRMNASRNPCVNAERASAPLDLFWSTSIPLRFVAATRGRRINAAVSLSCLGECAAAKIARRRPAAGRALTSCTHLPTGVKASRNQERPNIMRAVCTRHDKSGAVCSYTQERIDAASEKLHCCMRRYTQCVLGARAAATIYKPSQKFRLSPSIEIRRRRRACLSKKRHHRRIAL